MNKHLLKVKAFLEKRQASIAEKLKGSLTDEQKSKIDSVKAQIDEALASLEAATEDATIDQVVSVFAGAVEALTASNDMATQEMQAKMESKLIELQAKITSNASKMAKFKADLSLKKLKASTKNDKGWKEYTAGIDVDAWTPESEIDNVEIYHPLIGVTQGFDVTSTTNTSIKVRKLSKASGGASVVLDHAAKPVIELIGSQSIVNVATFAGIVEGIADEDLEDNPGLEREIQQEALTDLGEYENTAAIALLEAQAKAYGNAKFGTKVGADELTALAAIIDQVKQALGKRMSPICLALNSSTWAKLNDLRANTSGVMLSIDAVLGDVIRITDNSLDSDNFYCWAKNYTKIKMYKNPQVDWYKGVQVTTSEGNVTAVYSEWRTDEQSVRVRQRQAIYTSDSSVIVKGTISGVVEAVTTSQN